MSSPTAASPRVIVVTGAAGGIGRELIAGFLNDGDHVVAVDLEASRVLALTAPERGALTAFACDVSIEAEVVALFEAIERRHGRIDALINNAALGPTMAATVDTTLEGFRRALNVNLIGPFLMAREAARRMGPGGVIVNIASLAGVLGNPRRNAYAASKAGLISFTKSLACEWAARGIRVCGVAPGYVRTPMVGTLESTGKVDLAAVRRRIPLGRLARPDEIASVAKFLASGAARYVTGAVFAVDGGWMSFNQPGDAHPPVEGTPADELVRPEVLTKRRIVIVTGAATGIGEAIARRFAAEGNAVVAVDRDRDGVRRLAAELGPDHMALEADIASESAVVSLFAEVRERFGGLDILVNNAGVADVFQARAGADRRRPRARARRQSDRRLSLRARGDKDDAAGRHDPQPRLDQHLPALRAAPRLWRFKSGHRHFYALHGG